MIEFGSSRTGSSALPRRLDASNTQIKPRKTTDKLCLVLFFVLIGSIAFITIRDIKTTEFKHLMKPLDAAGNTCGENGASLDYTEYPYVYIDYPSKDSAALSQRVCVKSCPQSSSESLLCQPNQLVPLCNKLTVYSSKLVAGRLCVPSDLTFYKSISERLYSLDSSSVFEAATTNYRLIVFSLLIAMILSFTYSKLLTHYSFFIVLGSFGLAYGGIAVLGVLSYSKYGMLMRESETASDSVKMQQAAASYKVGAGMLWIVSAGLTFLTFMMIGRIRAAVGVIQTASRFVSENKVIVIVPILGLVSAVFVVIAWIFSALAFYSRATKKQSEESGYARIDWKYHKR